MIQYKIGSTSYIPKIWKFPAGEVGVRIAPHSVPYDVPRVVVQAALQNSDDIMTLMLLTDALQRQFIGAKIDLVIGYMPYGRQDRVMTPGESLSVRVFANLINAQGYNHVTLVDPHSSVSEAVFDNASVITQIDIFKHINGSWRNTILVAPDAGAYKKTCNFAQFVGAKDVLTFNKTRNLSNGKITALSTSGEIDPSQKYMIIDDIGDGMGTFIGLGEEFAKYGVKPDLVITHGLFTKGIECFRGYFDNVVTSNSFHMDRDGEIDGIKYINIF